MKLDQAFPRPLSQKKQGKSMLGDKSVLKKCKKLLNKEYKEPERVVWELIKTDRIDYEQFKMLVNSIPEKSVYI